MLFGKMLFVCLNRNVQPLVGNNPALVKWVFRRVLPGTKRNKFVILLEVWKWQLRCPAYRFQRGLPPPRQFLCELLKFLLSWHLIKASHLHIDRMYLSPPQEGHNCIACLLHLETTLHNLRVILRHTHHVGIPKKVGRVQHIDMQRMALDPFTTVEEPPQFAQLPTNRDTQCLLHRVYSAHLVSHWTNATDARGNIRSLCIHATTQQRLKEARRLVDPQFHIHHLVALDFYIQGTFPFNTSKGIHFDGLSFHEIHSPCGTPRNTH